MQQYLDGFNKKYPNIEVKYQSYSDYENEVSRQIADGDYSDVLFVPGSVSADKFACLLAICIIFAIVVLARFGGDEFVLCVDRKDVELVQPKLEELVTRMCRTFSYGEDSVPLSISLGAVYVTKEFPYEELFKVTDGVLYTVKEHGKNSFKIKNL